MDVLKFSKKDFSSLKELYFLQKTILLLANIPGNGIYCNKQDTPLIYQLGTGLG